MRRWKSGVFFFRWLGTYFSSPLSSARVISEGANISFGSGIEVEPFGRHEER
jgi:hypothetical protein